MASSSIFQQQLKDLNISINANDFSFTQLRYPVIGLILYLLTVVMFQPSEQAEKEKVGSFIKEEKHKVKPKTTKLSKAKLFMFIHNIFLCIFSWLCFLIVFQ